MLLPNTGELTEEWYSRGYEEPQQKTPETFNPSPSYPCKRRKKSGTNYEYHK